jgi:hypothetical protein
VLVINVANLATVVVYDKNKIVVRHMRHKTITGRKYN